MCQLATNESRISSLCQLPVVSVSLQLGPVNPGSHRHVSFLVQRPLTQGAMQESAKK